MLKEEKCCLAVWHYYLLVCFHLYIIPFSCCHTQNKTKKLRVCLVVGIKIFILGQLNNLENLMHGGHCKLNCLPCIKSQTFCVVLSVVVVCSL